jgi:hypothetical protein
MAASKKRKGTRKELHIGSLGEHQFVEEASLEKLRKSEEASRQNYGTWVAVT